ncbi:MAG: hypothetical protein ABSG34_06805 [Candidatus Sulfotelmatobacter sp.]
MPQRKRATVAIAILLSAGAGCTKQDAPRVNMTTPLDQVVPSSKGPTEAQVVLEKTFSLKSSATFPFEIPSHASRPHLHGIFQSFVGKAGGASDSTADIEFVILNEEQQANVASDRPSDALFSVESSHNQAVNFDLPPSMNQPVKYYLVFHNVQGSKSNKVVEANFRIDF